MANFAVASRLRVALGPRQEAQQDLQSRPSPAAFGASAVRGAPIAGLGPVLPARPVPKKTASSTKETVTSPSYKATEKTQQQLHIRDDGSELKGQQVKSVSKPSKDSSLVSSFTNPNKQISNDQASKIREQYAVIDIAPAQLQFLFSSYLGVVAKGTTDTFRFFRKYLTLLLSHFA
ncbi:hypothetical protein FRX31_007429 [Thalictrum thalictroides]|uniref:Uncharacterized protein n=1 Tax=Thalictrum thalictroides TaxID=46969 RepID=A0A7J6WZX7_THATH|nr:hypothetical protein FRX31_007429 [Thalictrum thalictroides]